MNLACAKVEKPFLITSFPATEFDMTRRSWSMGDASKL
jgi:hypothetical protein